MEGKRLSGKEEKEVNLDSLCGKATPPNLKAKLLPGPIHRKRGSLPSQEDKPMAIIEDTQS
jgi:hypothetical protein